MVSSAMKPAYCQVVREDEQSLVEVQPVASECQVKPGPGIVEMGALIAQIDDHPARLFAALSDSLGDRVGSRIGGLGLDSHGHMRRDRIGRLAIAAFETPHRQSRALAAS